jgi:DnaK suppressor protein
MPAHDLKKLRAALLARRVELVAEGDVPVPMQRLDAVSKPDEDETPLTEMNQIIASNRNRARTAAMQSLDEALARMTRDPEAFGVCETCDEPIAERRLILVPQATLCATCQAEEEARNKPGQTRKHLTDYR